MISYSPECKSIFNFGNLPLTHYTWRSKIIEITGFGDTVRFRNRYLATVSWHQKNDMWSAFLAKHHGDGAIVLRKEGFKTETLATRWLEKECREFFKKIILKENERLEKRKISNLEWLADFGQNNDNG